MQRVENIEYKRISKKAIGCMRVTALIAHIFLVGVVAAVFLLLSGNDIIPSTVAYIVIAAAAVLAVVYIAVAPAVRYKRYKYYLDDDMLVVVEGLFFIKKSIAPIERLHQIAINRGPLDRMFGVSNVVVTTAGGEVKIAFLEDEVAEDISAKLKTRINNIVKAEKAEQTASADLAEKVLSEDK